MNELFAAPDPFRSTFFLVGLPILWVATGLLKSRGFGHEGDIRKINHVAAFTGGALLFGWLPEPVARSSMYATCPVILLLVVLTCRFRHRPPFSHAFAANTRKRDAPHEAFYFWSSWLISMLAVAAIDLAFRQLAVTRTAALIVGIADGLAEPIGRRLGRHCYPVPAIRGDRTFRSVEGSAVVLFSTLAVMLVCTTPASAGIGGWLPAVLVTSLAVTAVEAISPRGTDNFTVPLTSACLSWLWLVTARIH